MAHPPTVVDAVVQGLRGRILSGNLQPGMTLPPERQLAGQLDVSRATLREGLSIFWPIFDAIRRRHALDARAAMLAHFAQLEQVLRELGLGDRTVGSYVVGDPVAPAGLAGSETARKSNAPDAERR